jgi:radical SAM superfamily enzyme YgiQ (UPF0313 family)
MKILLIDPPFQKFVGLQKYYIPLGLLYLAGELRKKHDVTVYDADYFPEGKPLSYIEQGDKHHLYTDALDDDNHPVWTEIDNVFKEIQPDVVGITLISTKFISGMRIAERYKKLGAKRIICGGPFVTISPDEVLSNPYVDSIVIGEGEHCFEEAFEKEKVFGSRITDLDALAFPARDRLYNLKKYTPKDLGMILTSRGCPFNCNFCCSVKLWGRKVIYRSVDNVVEEIKQVKDNHGTTDFYIVDDSFTSTKKRTLEFCEKIKDVGVTWSCLTRVDLVDEEVVTAMKNSGCKMIKVGIESGSEKILKIMNKKIRREEIRRAADVFKKVGMKWFSYFIIGIPEETKEDLQETIDFCKEVRPNFISFSVYTPLPGTPFYEALGEDKKKYHMHSLHNIFTEFTQLTLKDVTDAISFADDYNRGII